MKPRFTLIPILLISAISGCGNDDTAPMPPIDGLSLYWDHEVFGDEGRRLRFAFNSTNEFASDYDMAFKYSIDGNSITARLVKSIDNGKCPYFPMPSIEPDDPGKCSASGGFYIPDDELNNGIYSFKIITPYFEVTSGLTITDERITLTTPPNEQLASSVDHVYPIPEDLLFGSVVFEGSNNKQDAENFFNDLISSGVTAVTVPNYPYRHLRVDENGQANERHWEPDNHLIGFLYRMNNDFNTVVEVSKRHFSQTTLNIYLYTGNGDQGIMEQGKAAVVVYGK